MEIRRVLCNKDLKRFIHFPHQLYKDDESYVPTLNIMTKSTLGTQNPFLKHSQIALFLAISNGFTVGRIAAIYNKTHIETYHDETGFFGFFEAINDLSVAKSLFEASEQWLKSKGVKRIIGPTNLTTNDSCGFLTEGFQEPPIILMPYNKPYYNDLCCQSGYSKLIDLNSYRIDVNHSPIEKYHHIYSKALQFMQASGIQIRNFSKRSFKKETEQLRFVYNKSNEKNWGFMPLNEEEFTVLARDLKMATPLDLTFFAEKGGEMIGFLIVVPDLNQAFKFMKNGKLSPFNIFRFLQKKRTVNSARIMILGILDEYRGMGIDLVMYQHLKEALNKHHIYNAEACYVLENNQQMNTILDKLSEGVIKKYRIYEKRNRYTD